MMNQEPRSVLKGAGIQGFENLMPYRIREVLLVSSLYDSFVFQEDGQVLEPLLADYGELNLRYAPRVKRVSTVEEAMETLSRNHRFDLVIVTPLFGEADTAGFAEEVKATQGGMPVVLLGNDARAIQVALEGRSRNPFDYVLHWNGDSRLMVAVIKLIEDRVNFLHDSTRVGVRGVLLVEDSLKFLSSYLPLLYAEIFAQSQRVLSDAVNLSHKLLRLRARPKVLLAQDVAGAERIVREHGRYLLGVISDAKIPEQRDGLEVDGAGLKLMKWVRTMRPELPIMVQSSDARKIDASQEIGATFVDKSSPLLYQHMREFMLHQFGFGPFVFRNPDGTVEATAGTIRELEEAVQGVTDECILNHGTQNHFSTWLRARTEFELADRMAPKKVADFSGARGMRSYLNRVLHESRLGSQRGTIADFDRNSFDNTIDFCRVGGGSLGGKARGLAFINYLLRYYQPGKSFRGVKVLVPPAVVLTTELFDRFMEDNNLLALALGEKSDLELQEMFVQADLPPDLVEDLAAISNTFDGPLAVRSSSLLEDSHLQPFAGIYSTFMLPNCECDEEQRLAALCRAVKLVYASTYSRRAKSFIRATPYLHEEEKMGVVIQRLFGREHDGKYYPSFAGVARSHNYYPYGPVQPNDGVCTVALGLGRTVVEGGAGLRFCPRHPLVQPENSTVEDVLENAQRTFYALRLDCSAEDSRGYGTFESSRFDLKVADEDGTLAGLASTWSSENETISDGVSRAGVRLVTFASVLKHGSFPLAGLMEELLEAGRWGMGSPVEIEFAVDLESDSGLPKRLALLQVRPMVVDSEKIEVDLEQYSTEQLLCTSNRALGNCRYENIYDVLFVDPLEFDRANSRETAALIGEFNARLVAEERPYILAGPGRWGSSDPWLGIPVEWGQISGVKTVVETGFDNLRVEPSEGSHFFNNMTSFHVGYLTVNPQIGEGKLDLD
ncbi:MAG: PEP/pyruvate-binding domain-containing protein, partial [Planctomycetota bacterium]|nr:PEP/pyruvate-binding domain-containing protein [Planctomycetota bacterium]